MVAVSQLRYRATVEYDGTDFLGYQYQKVGRTVQGEIEKSLNRLTQSQIRIIGAGRTDAGVHATGQVIAFDLSWKHPLSDLHRALNATLPPDVIVQELEIVRKDFHPRFDAVSRSYRYTVINQPWPSVLQRRYAHHVKDDLDIRAMNEACEFLIGSHDFASFGKPPQGHNTTRHVMRAKWSAEGRQLEFDITANAFLYHMVRKIVGTLLQVGLGHLQSGDLKNILEVHDLTRAAEPAPAHGLCLVKVTYPENVV